jgi:hypothetical protein
MKLLVETKDNLQVHGNGEEMWARYNRPSVVRQVAFMDTNISNGQLKMLAQLNDDATDAEFAELWDATDEKDREALKTDYAKDYAPDAKKKKGETAPPPPPAK